ncbi:MAG: hypothetical protein ACREBA_08740, partial [Nitrosotalea sp.]
MRTLYYSIIVILVLFSFLILMTNHNSYGCLLNSDWPYAPCYAIPGLHVTKEQMKKDWAGYYLYKEPQWMEMKRTEMVNATADRV